MSIFGSSYAASNICPHCRSRVDLNAYGTVAPHTSPRTGSTCTGSGVPAMPVPPWPGNAPSVRSLARRRKSSLRQRRADRKAERVPMAR